MDRLTEKPGDTPSYRDARMDLCLFQHHYYSLKFLLIAFLALSMKALRKHYKRVTDQWTDRCEDASQNFPEPSYVHSVLIKSNYSRKNMYINLLSRSSLVIYLPLSFSIHRVLQDADMSRSFGIRLSMHNYFIQHATY